MVPNLPKRSSVSQNGLPSMILHIKETRRKFGVIRGKMLDKSQSIPRMPTTKMQERAGQVSRDKRVCDLDQG